MILSPNLCAYWLSCVFFGEVFVQSFCPFFIGLLIFLLLIHSSSFCIGYEPVVRFMYYEYFPPVCGLPIYFLNCVLLRASIFYFDEV